MVQLQVFNSLSSASAFLWMMTHSPGQISNSKDPDELAQNQGREKENKELALKNTPEKCLTSSPSHSKVLLGLFLALFEHEQEFKFFVLGRNFFFLLTH